MSKPMKTLSTVVLGLLLIGGCSKKERASQPSRESGANKHIQTPDGVGGAQERPSKKRASPVDPKLKAAKAQTEKVAGALTVYAGLKGGLPKSLRSLVADELLSPRELKDPWGSNFRFSPAKSKRGHLVEVCSSGPDMKAGTADDICVRD